MKRIQIIIGCLALLAFLITGALLHWKWAGFDKPLYDWMQLLIIPIVLAFVAVWFNRIDKKNELMIAQKRVDDERTLAIDNQREMALQGYLDRMQDLLLHEKLRGSMSGDEVRNVARVRTLTMLYQLDARRINYLLAFLREAGLLTADSATSIIKLNNALLSQIDLPDVNFSHVDLNRATLINANLSFADLSFANLNDVKFSGAILKGTYLSGATLIFAKFSSADLSGANLSGANLSGATLNKAILKGATLIEADLKGADLNFANLIEANLKGVNLSGATLIKANLSGATLIKTNLSGANLIEARLSGAKIDLSSLKQADITKEQRATLIIVPH